MKRLFLVSTILATAAAALQAMTSMAPVAESGSMLLIGVGLVLTASIARRKMKTR